MTGTFDNCSASQKNEHMNYLHSLHNFAEVMLILILHRGQTQRGGRFGVHDLSKPGLALHDAVRYALLPAQGWKPDHQLDGVHVVGNDHQLCLALQTRVSTGQLGWTVLKTLLRSSNLRTASNLLNEVRHVVDSVLHH